MPNYKYAYRGKDNNAAGNGADNEEDWLDNVCNQASNVMCPLPQEQLPGEAPPKEDLNAMDKANETQTLEVVGSKDKTNASNAPDVKENAEKDTLDLLFEKVEGFACGSPSKESLQDAIYDEEMAMQQRGTSAAVKSSTEVRTKSDDQRWFFLVAVVSVIVVALIVAGSILIAKAL